MQFMLALVPLLLTPLLIFILAEGVLDFGGAEKDILLALPWLIWSAVFALCSFVFIYRRWTVRKWLLRSALIASGVLVGVWIIAFVGSFLGIA